MVEKSRGYINKFGHIIIGVESGGSAPNGSEKWIQLVEVDLILFTLEGDAPFAGDGCGHGDEKHEKRI